MTLEEAIAEVKSGRIRTPGPCARTILNAVASGDLIPKAGAELAVAAAYQRACEPVEANFPGTLYASNRTKAIAAILALAPADALAEVERMKAERDAAQHFNRQLRDEITEYQLIRDDQAAGVARLREALALIAAVKAKG